MLYRGTVQYLIEVPAWVEADSPEEAQTKLESMGPSKLKEALLLENVLDIHPNEMTAEELEQFEYEELP